VPFSNHGSFTCYSQSSRHWVFGNEVHYLPKQYEVNVFTQLNKISVGNRSPSSSLVNDRTDNCGEVKRAVFPGQSSASQNKTREIPRLLVLLIKNTIHLY
jgi:hypothetical protein